MTTDTNSAQEASTTTAPVQPNISINDLHSAVQIIDYAADQGAFKGWGVIEQVKTIRDRLNAFVVASTPKKEEAEKPKAGPKKITKAPAGAKKSASVAKAK